MPPNSDPNITMIPNPAGPAGFPFGVHTDPVARSGDVPAGATQVGGNHYKTMGIQPWEVIDTWPLEQQIGFFRGGALKYLMRMGSKDEQLQEIKKARHYLDKLIEVLSK